MIPSIPQLIRLKLFRTFGFPPTLPFNYTLLISTQCNSRCKTCKIWKQKHKNLALFEWKKILTSLGKSPFQVVISGGEPFLQSHLVNLCQLVLKTCSPTILIIPTNSLLFKTISQKVEAILKSAPRTKLIINLSLDAIGQKHDQIRGVPGNFKAFQKNYQNLKKLKTKYPNLIIGVHSVISKYNVQYTKELFDYALSLKPDQYITEIAEERKELDSVGLPITPSHQEYSKTIRYLIKRINSQKFEGFAKITKAFRLQYYQFVKDWLRNRPIPIKDYAGWASCEISSSGQVWPSCIHATNLGNLKKSNYSFPQIWFGKKAQKFRKIYQNKPESFPLANAFYSSAIFDLKTLLKVASNTLSL